MWVAKNGRSEIGPSVVHQGSEILTASKELGEVVPCANQFLDLQSMDNQVPTIGTSVKGSFSDIGVGSPGYPKNNLGTSGSKMKESDAQVLSGVSEDTSDPLIVSVDLPSSSSTHEGNAAFDFLPDVLGEGMKNPEAVFQALTALEIANSKKASEEQKPGAGRSKSQVQVRGPKSPGKNDQVCILECRGLNDPIKQVEIRKFIHANSLSLIGIVESKLRKENAVATMKNCLPSDWDFVHNGDYGPVARMVVAWRAHGSVVRKLFASEQMILLSVEIDMKCFFISVTYGFNQVNSRRQLWVDLRSCFGLVGAHPWILIGDFNPVRRQNEKSDPNHFDANAASEFNCCLEDIEMEDLNSKGLVYLVK